MPPIRNSNGSTHWMTPVYAYAVLLNYLRPIATKWKRIFDPFPDKNSHCLRIAERAGTHIEGIDLQWSAPASVLWDFDTVPEDCDCVITNPPFSEKSCLLLALIKKDKPFCLLLPLDCLNVAVFQEHSSFHLIIPRKRFYFIEANTMTSNRCSFACAWFCWNCPNLPPKCITYAFAPQLHGLYRPGKDRSLQEILEEDEEAVRPAGAAAPTPPAELPATPPGESASPPPVGFVFQASQIAPFAW